MFLYYVLPYIGMNNSISITVYYISWNFEENIISYEKCKVAGIGGKQKCFHFSRIMLRMRLKHDNGNIFRITGPVTGEFPAQRPVTRSFDIVFDLRLNKRLSKQS